MARSVSQGEAVASVARVAGAGIRAEPSADDDGNGDEVLLNGVTPPTAYAPSAIWPSSSPTPTCSPWTSAPPHAPTPSGNGQYR